MFVSQTLESIFSLQNMSTTDCLSSKIQMASITAYPVEYTLCHLGRTRTFKFSSSNCPSVFRSYSVSVDTFSLIALLSSWSCLTWSFSISLLSYSV